MTEISSESPSSDVSSSLDTSSSSSSSTSSPSSSFCLHSKVTFVSLPPMMVVRSFLSTVHELLHESTSPAEPVTTATQLPMPVQPNSPSSVVHFSSSSEPSKTHFTSSETVVDALDVVCVLLTLAKATVAINPTRIKANTPFIFFPPKSFDFTI